ncbi:hypothetical protein [Marinoscillum pacificum]|uniref:hypothetical protein n=1 Tax=Marinoscillum pacificum TaxID=392723 RepID=UPI002158790E|nr:hypothetical protein [Marinoscillum pacificum]
MLKTTLHYLGEVLVVTIGIFIAFQLNNYSENQKLKSREENALKRIASDLETEKAWLQKVHRNYTRSKEKLESILNENDRENLDSLYYHLAKEYVHFNYNVEYSTLKFSGNLYLITNDSIRSSLVKHYELNYAYSEEVAERHKAFVETYILGYLSDELSLNATYLYDPLEVEKKLKNEELQSKMRSQSKWYGMVLTAVKLKFINDLLDLIDHEIQSKTSDS